MSRSARLIASNSLSPAVQPRSMRARLF